MEESKEDMSQYINILIVGASGHGKSEFIKSFGAIDSNRNLPKTGRG